MGILQDVKAMMKKQNLVLLEKWRESGDVHTFRFSVPPAFQWKAGQHGIVSITHKKIKKGIRPFSIASSPTENFLQITTRIPEQQTSLFKQALKELEPGMSLGFRGPVGSMYSDGSQPLVLVAAGLGITPFRAIIRDLESSRTSTGTTVEIIHYDRINPNLFEKDWPVKSGAIQLKWTRPTTREDFGKAVLQAAQQYGNRSVYLLAGAASMTRNITKLLREQGVSKQNIKKDLYFGQ